MSNTTNGRTLTGREIIFTMGWNMAGYMPDSDNVSVFTSAKDARIALADEIDRFIDHEVESAMAYGIEPEQVEDTADGYLWPGQAYAEHARNMLAKDHHAELPDWFDSAGQVCVQVEDVRGYSHTYWVQATRVSDTYGSITEAEETAKWDDNTRDVLNELEDEFHDSITALLGQETVSLIKVYRAR